MDSKHRSRNTLSLFGKTFSPSMLLERRAIKKGRWRMILVLTVLFVGAVSAGVFIFVPDAGAPYRKLSDELATLKRVQYDSFWECALRDVDPQAIKNDVALVENIHRYGAQSRAGYAKHVTSRCAPRLQSLASQISRMQTPPDVHGNVDELAGSLNQLRDAWTSYTSALVQLDDRYSPDDFNDQTTEIARAWFGFARAHAQLAATARKKGDTSFWRGLY